MKVAITSRRASAANWAIIAPLTTVLIWSGNAVVTKLASNVIAPGSIAFYRWLLALLVLTPFIAPKAWANRQAVKPYWKEMIILGFFGMVIYQCLAYVAAQTTTAVNMGVILALMPLFSTLLASVLASEKLTTARVVGGIISIGGLLYLTSRGNFANLVNGGFHLGDGIMLIAVLANALYGVLVKRWSIPLPLWQSLFWQILAATIILVPIWALGPISPVTAQNIPLILFAAIPASLLAPLLWMVGINRLGAARTALTINLIPVVVAVLAWLFLGEQLQGFHYIGGGVALLGVIVGLREWKAGKPRTDDPSVAAWKGEEI
ncbi:DMT family transporter [Caulobacter sp. 602-2]|uniref:DMT family transporter n=1 Tax=Caulobacter sp. 602-2 TaxID=2710887 RepID=A0A6G4QSM3_9CAUL|nr:DMT family transporter [Caulobacter sp. 602-2]NGM48437.1 DMT family transporter [Caulobacter sp. 602-2]